MPANMVASAALSTPPTKKRIVSPSSTSKGCFPGSKETSSASPPSAPTPVGWPDLLPSSAEDLSLYEKMSPAVFSRSTTSESMGSAIPYPKLQPPPPRPSKRAPDVAAPVVAKESAQKKSKSPSVCTAAKSVAVKHEVQEDFAKQPILRLKHLTSMSLKSPPQPKAAAPTPAAPAEQPPAVPKQAPDTAPQRLEEEPNESTGSSTAPRDATATLHEAPAESEVTCTTTTGSVPTLKSLKHEPGTLQARASALRRPSCKPEPTLTPARVTFAEPATPPEADQPPMSVKSPQPEAAQPKAATPPTPAQPKASQLCKAATPSTPAAKAAPKPASSNATGGVTVAENLNVTPVVPGNYHERQALQAEFKRRLRDPSANEIPDDFVTLWQDAVRTNSKAAKSALFEKWLSAGKDWSLLVVESSKSHTDKSTADHYMRWKTRAQIIALHGGDKDAADSIIATKEAQGLVQDHPDTPGLKTFYVTTDLGRRDEEETKEKTKIASTAKMNPGSEGAKKLMNGLDLTNFSKLRKAGPTPTVTPETQKRPDPKKKAAKEMPLDDPIKALEWMVPKLLKDLTEAKILPIKMANLKHQQKLRESVTEHTKKLEETYFKLKPIADTLKEDPSGLDTEEKEAELVDMINDAVQVRDDYHQSATMAVSLTKPRGGKKQKDQKADEDDKPAES